ncbi:MAG: D-aminoacyl-tRNA deacylase [bacterium]
MIVVIQRVLKASVSVEGKLFSSINRGLLILVGLEKNDVAADLEYCVKKVTELRIFQDNLGKMNLSVADIGGEILAVSQFTLAGDIRKGRRPGFDNAMEPILAEKMFNRFISMLVETGISIKIGSFGDNMEVSLINDGPVTFVVDSKKRI